MEVDLDKGEEMLEGVCERCITRIEMMLFENAIVSDASMRTDYICKYSPPRLAVILPVINATTSHSPDLTNAHCGV